MAIALAILALIALLLFVVWERRNKASSDHQVRTHGAPPIPTKELATSRNFARLCLGLALVAMAIAFSEWLNPSARPYTGRWSWVKEALFLTLGPAGPALLWVGIAVALVAAARIVWRHTSKKPSDRLLW